MQYCELPALPRPIGLVSDIANLLATESIGSRPIGSSHPAGNAPARAFARSFSPGRRRSGRR